MNASTALSCTSVSLPPIIIALFIGKKSLCPDQLDAMTGFPVIVNSNNGLPNPSPFVKFNIAFTFGCSYNPFICDSVKSPCKR